MAGSLRDLLTNAWRVGRRSRCRTPASFLALCGARAIGRDDLDELRTAGNCWAWWTAFDSTVVPLRVAASAGDCCSPRGSGCHRS